MASIVNGVDLSFGKDGVGFFFWCSGFWFLGLVRRSTFRVNGIQFGLQL